MASGAGGGSVSGGDDSRELLMMVDLVLMVVEVRLGCDGGERAVEGMVMVVMVE